MTRIIKEYTNKFTVISNNEVQDKRLSWKARGIFSYLWSMPDNWDFYETEVAKHAPDGRDSLRSGLMELEEHGYLKRERVRNKGQFGGTAWIITDNPTPKTENQTPMLENPTQGSPMLENPTQENPTLQNKYHTQDLHTNRLTPAQLTLICVFPLKRFGSSILTRRGKRPLPSSITKNGENLPKTIQMITCCIS
mgnify:CR=1 FL=1